MLKCRVLLTRQRGPEPSRTLCAVECASEGTRKQAVPGYLTHTLHQRLPTPISVLPLVFLLFFSYFQFIGSS